MSLVNLNFINLAHFDLKLIGCRYKCTLDPGYPIKDILIPGDVQSVICASIGDINTGNCEYQTPYDTLRMSWYHNIYGHEVYGITNSPDDMYMVDLDVYGRGYTNYTIFDLTTDISVVK